VSEVAKHWATIAKAINQRTLIYMKTVLTIFILFFTTKTICQSTDTSKLKSPADSYAIANLDHYTIDTFYLKSPEFKEVVAYNLSGVTIYIPYKDYINDLRPFWKRYKHSMKIKTDPDDYVNPDYEPRWRVIDSMYQIAKKSIKHQDTIYVFQRTFGKVGVGPIVYFEKQIESGECKIIDDHGIQQNMIIRVKGSRVRGPLDGWGGRIFFLNGRSHPFYEAGDWFY
jgi:hypothetical protein